MTDTTNTIENTEHAEDSGAEPQPLGMLEHLHPNELQLGENVRDAVDLGKEFLASLREHGVLVPITAVRSDDGTTVVVRNGQRRTLGAREVGLAAVPVYVLPANASDDTAEAVERIVHQIVTNDQKDDLTDAQRARGIQQMIDAGLSATKVAKRLSVSRATVKAATTAAASATAMDALASGQLSLVEAAAAVEFEDDPAALQRLVDTSGSPDFDHTVAQLRQERQSAQAYAAEVAHYREQGYTVLEEQPRGVWGDTSHVPLRHLLTADGGAATDAVITNPAHWAVLLYEDSGWADRVSGEPVNEATIDWSTEDDDTATPAEGMRHANSVVETTVFDPEWFCLDYVAAGLELTDIYKRNADRAGTAGSAQGDADDEAARLQREAEQAETDKRERRKVLALNKLGAAAATVRREFMTKLLAHKTPPKGAAVFVAGCLARDKFLLDQHHGDEFAAELLGLDDAAAIGKLVAGLGSGGDARAQLVTLALVLGSLEARFPKDAWRSGGTGWLNAARPSDLLHFLGAQGYTLSAIEKVITGQADADTVFDEQAAAA